MSNSTTVAAGHTRTTHEARRSRQFLFRFGVVILSLIGIRMLMAWDESTWIPWTYAKMTWEHPAGQLYLVGTVVLLGLGFVFRRAGRDTFGLHALQVMLGAVSLNWLIATALPLSIKMIGSSYLIFFYHFPAAMSCFVFFTLLMVFSIAYLVQDDPLWDRCARTSGQIGFLACTIVLTTGSTWASAAWNSWWVWDDPRLMSAAIMWLTYAGYVMLQMQLDDPYKRRRFCAVFGIIAFLNLPIVHYAIQWFSQGEVSHPMKFSDMASNDWITYTRWFGVIVFVGFYSILFRWRLAREGTRDRLHESLWAVRRLEEGAHIR